MGKSSRWLVVGAVALGGILLFWLGIAGWSAILAAGMKAAEMWGTMAYTVVGIVVGAGMVLWCLFDGIPWARSQDSTRSAFP